MKATHEQLFRIRTLTFNPSVSFTEDDLALLPGLHDCPEWDGPIFEGMPEWDACTCATRTKP
jgi:hypothetical protein